MNEINIIGSGLSGPLLATLLGNKNCKVNLFEKRKDIRTNIMSAGRSINLALSHRGIKALKEAGVYQKIENELIPMKGRLIHNINGNTQYQPYSINSSDHINSISRNKLNKILLDKAEEIEKVEINFEHSLIKVDNNNLIFSNNKKHILNNNLVFGADGFNSEVRKYIDSKIDNKTNIQFLSHSYKELHINPDKNGNFKLDKNVLHIWPRGEFMLIALPNIDKSFTCTLFMPNSGKNSFETLISIDDVVSFFRKNFSDVIDLFNDFPDSYFDNPIGNLGSINTKNWNFRNQFCLIGDSAHAIVPFFGQGMNASFEDCSVLMQYYNKLSGNWSNTIDAFCLNRVIDTQAISKMAIDNYIEMRNSVSKSSYIKKKKISDILYKNFSKYFIPKYNMVSFTSIPYSEVYKRSLIQEEILDELVLDFSLDKAAKLIYKKLIKF